LVIRKIQNYFPELSGTEANCKHLAGDIDHEVASVFLAAALERLLLIDCLKIGIKSQQQAITFMQ
jgi:hypothetical protein